MNAVFDHIEQTRYLLSQVFESGFTSGRNASVFGESERIAEELGMSGGAQLLKTLNEKIKALAAGQIGINSAVAAYCNVVSYYNMVADMLAIETMSTKKE